MTTQTNTGACFGLWQSPIDASLVASSSIKYAEPRFYHDSLFWLESRPSEKGRCVVVQHIDGTTKDVLPAPFSARTQVHEYGGGAYCIGFDCLFFVNAADQRLYKQALNQPDPELLLDAQGFKYADLSVDPTRERLICVGEQSNDMLHPAHCLLATSIHGHDAPKILAEGHDFYANPRVSPDGQWLSFLTWDHPDMPWDNTQLWLARIEESGELATPVCIAGGDKNQSLFQPQWHADGSLFFASDINNWWNLYQLTITDLTRFATSPEAEALRPQPVFVAEAEFATPLWVFNMSTYAFLDQDRIIFTATQNGQWTIGTLTRQNPNAEWQHQRIQTEANSISGMCSNGNGEAACVAASPASPPAIMYFKEGELKQKTPVALAPALKHSISEARPITIPNPKTSEDIYAFYYAPKNAAYEPPPRQKPPCIVICHGGPTGATDPSLNWKIQYWTTRGFAVLDVNYRGSTGYGRKYRKALEANWGIADVEDLALAASYLRENGLAHPQQIIIKGGSAGGYTVLAALTTTKAFNAGVTLYGIGDLEILATDTHKFEAHYLDGLIGPYPQMQAEYIARSPIYKVDQIDCPVLIYQGSEDKVVPPNQAESMFQALKDRGTPVAYILYEGEGHGFRQASTIAHQLASELAFYQRVLKLNENVDDANLVEIFNFD